MNTKEKNSDARKSKVESWSLHPEVQHDIQLRAAPQLDELIRLCDGEEEKSAFLLAWAVAAGDCVEQLPVRDMKLHQLPAGVPRERDVLLPLQVFQLGQSLPLEFHAEPLRDLRQAADPFAGHQRVARALDPAVGRPEVGVAA